MVPETFRYPASKLKLLVANFEFIIDARWHHQDSKVNLVAGIILHCNGFIRPNVRIDRGVRAHRGDFAVHLDLLKLLAHRKHIFFPFFG